MKILVTGGTGFIAAWVIRRLMTAGHAVRVLDVRADRSEIRQILGPSAASVEWQIGDIRDPKSVSAAMQGCDGVAHLAAILTPDCQKNPILGAEINLIGALNIFEAARQNNLRHVVYASSAGVYGPDDGSTPHPITHYGAFKLAVEGSARAYWEDHKVSSIGFRPFVVYGPGRESGLTAGPTFACRAAARGENYTIPYTGISDMLYVDDLAAAFEAALDKPLGGAHVFNLVGEVASTEQVVAEIHRNVPGAKIDAAGPKLPSSATIDMDPDVERLLGALPRTPLAEGIKKTIAYYRQLETQ